MPTQLKRKRPSGGGSDPASNTSSPSAVVPPRRATRQTSNAPLSVPPDPEPRRRRRGADSSDGQAPTVVMTVSQHSRSPRGNKENIPVEAEQLLLQQQQRQQQQQQQQQQSQPLKPSRLTRHSGGLEAVTASASVSSPAASRSTPKTTNASRPRNNTASAQVSVIPPPANMVRPLPRSHESKPPNPHVQSNVSAAGAHHQSVSVGRHKPITMATSTTPRQQQQQLQQQQPQQQQQHHHQSNGANSTSSSNVISTDQSKSRKSTPTKDSTDRNIDKVVLGDICFRAWYPSYYGKDVLGDPSANAHNHNTSTSHDDSNGGAGGQASSHHGHGRREPPPMLDRLYVCPCCFKYSKELVSWWEHVKLCEKKCFVPGRKIYTHPKGSRTILKPAPNSPVASKLVGRNKKNSVQPTMVEEVIQDQGEWSIYEVDGEVDVLFCQNLSLFAKLFLDNKSVFFDVTGFNYFLLVFSPPSGRPQIVGFFSKEKMSWDNNNLACILIFPPWQRKGLGALLMGISYEISRREGLLGGPEKPISDLGKKGYKRFWGGEIARWILTLPESEGEEEMVVDVEDCSEATWIAAEDCLVVLREMGVACEAGEGLPPRKRRKRTPQQEKKEGETGAEETREEAEGKVQDEEVKRVTISKRRVKEWVEKNGISLETSCDPNGFVEGYAVKVDGGGRSREGSEGGSP
ncbi:males-absent on the first protein [Cladorrhinum samala]|uniref:histone acetyltransferase n=1 Tax=Cladorrhinum samala TaxID=585594 RepID=A0AAV9HP45_9PEZI|nr:males-absent on the first protein [Cladorrhinum samala]